MASFNNSLLLFTLFLTFSMCKKSPNIKDVEVEEGPDFYALNYSHVDLNEIVSEANPAEALMSIIGDIDNIEEGFVNGLTPEQRKECNDIWKKIKKNRCSFKSKKKYAKQLARKLGGGGFKLKDSEFELPGWASFKSEVNSLNGIVEMYYNAQIQYCNQSHKCDVTEWLVFCYEANGLSVPKNTQERWNDCSTILKKDITEILTNSLKSLDSLIIALNNKKIDPDIVKAVMDAEFKKLDITKKEDSPQDTTSTNLIDTSSTSVDSLSKVVLDTIREGTDTSSTTEIPVDTTNKS